MPLSLTKPSEGTVDWSSGVNQNFTDIENWTAALDCGIWNDRKATNTDGGTFTSGAWQTRTLNNAVRSPSWASLSSNTVTVTGDGNYVLLAWAPAFAVNNHQARANINSGTNTYGTCEHASNASSGYNKSLVVTYFVRSGSNVTITIEHQAQTTKTTDGFGRKNNFTTSDTHYEVYTTLLLVRLPS